MKKYATQIDAMDETAQTFSKSIARIELSVPAKVLLLSFSISLFVS